jgi:hypothetical protein
LERGASEALEREFDWAMAQSGVTVPEPLREGARAVFAELRHMASLLRQPREAEIEPAHGFDIRAILRQSDAHGR